MDEDFQRYLKPVALCESDAPEIVGLAKRIVKGKRGMAAARAIFKWVRDFIEYDLKTKMVGAQKVLQSKPMRAMCFDKTNLFIALCRASGIPARYIQMKCRLKTKKADVPPDAMHIVGEIYLNGKWTVADPSFDSGVKSLVEIGEIGKPTWTKVYSEKHLASLPPIMPFLINNIVLNFSGDIKKVRAALEQIRAHR